MASISFEYFPPRNAKGHDSLKETLAILSCFQPGFQSVTYGAGGSSRENTLDTIRQIRAGNNSMAASHLTYTGSTAAEIAEFSHILWEEGIHKIIALRGDNRGHTDKEVFSNTAQFIRMLKRHHPFEIAVSCYPETHPQAASRAADIAVLKEKQDAGASLAISQFFFDNSLFYAFVKEARAAGIVIPLIPGVLPIHNFDKVKKMAETCGTSIPAFMTDAFSGIPVSGSNSFEIAAELLKAQVHDLAVAGFESIHVYTLNRGELPAIAARTFLTAHDTRSNNIRAA